MKKNYLYGAGILVLAALLGGNLAAVHGLKDELVRLNSRVSQLSYDIQGVQSQVQNRYAQVEDLVKSGQSLLSDVSVDVSTRERKLFVTMKAVPKELRSGETLIMRITAGDTVYEKEADENQTAAFLVEPTRALRPAVLLRSAEGLRQEILEEVDTEDLLSLSLQSSWSDNAKTEEEKWQLVVWLSAMDGDRALPFAPEEVEQAEFVLWNDGRSEPEGAETSVIRFPSGEKLFSGTGMERLTAKEMVSDGTTLLGYYADFGSYVEEKNDGTSHIFLILTLKDGTRFYSPEGFASFGNKSYIWADCGSGRLIPLYGETP